MSSQISEPRSNPPVPKLTLPSAMNLFFLIFFIGSVLYAAAQGRMREVNDASFQGAKEAVTLAVNLIGIMALWLGLVRVLEAGGLMFTLGRALRPVFSRMFPDVPPTHPAMGAIVLNVSANLLGLGNAATPFGIKAMIELNRLNPFPGVATDSMCLFVTLVTSSITLFPLGVIGVRAAAGSAEPAAIFLPTLLSTMVSTGVGVVTAVILARRDRRYRREFEAACVHPSARMTNEETTVEPELPTEEEYAHLRYNVGRLGRILGFLLPFTLLTFAIVRLSGSASPLESLRQEILSFWLMPGLMLLIASYGIARGVKVYEAVTEGARAGFETAVRIIPFLVSMLVAIAMFRASGAMELLTMTLSPITGLIGMPAEALPMAVVRPLSGSGAFAVMSALIEAGPDSYAAFVASTMQGATDTTFYILAVYCGAAGVTRVRHALVSGLVADVSGVVAASLLCPLFWNGG